MKHDIICDCPYFIVCPFPKFTGKCKQECIDEVARKDDVDNEC